MTWKGKQNYAVYENYWFNKKAYVEAKASLKMNEKTIQCLQTEKVCECTCVHKIRVLKIPGKYIQRYQQNILFSVVSYSSLIMICYYYSSKIKGILCPPPSIFNLTWC